MRKELSPEEQFAYDQYVHTPTEAYNALVSLARKIHGTKGVSSGSPNLDKFMIPTRGPWVRVWVAAPAQGKSTFLRTIAFNAAMDLVAQEMDDKFYVAFITYEEAVDAQEIHFQRSKSYTTDDFWRGNVNPKKVMMSGLDRPDIPIYWLGESMAKSDPDSPPMTIDKCLDGLRSIWKIEGKLPSCIVLDYVQEVEVDLGAGMDRTKKVIEAMRQIIRMGTLTGCAIELGAQARRSSLKNNPPLPSQDDVEWAHYVYQKATNAVGLWRPWTTHSKDPSVLANGITINEISFPLSPNLTVAMPLKHRPGLLRKPVPMEIDPATLTIKDFANIGNV